MRRGWVMMLAGAMALSMAGCSSGGGETATTGGSASTSKKLTIAVIPKGSTHEYWKSLHEGAQKAADELGVDIKWKSAVQEDDKQGQIDVVENFITTHVDGIVLAPLDNKALTNPVREAINSKIPVVIVDSGVDDVDYTSYVATNNEKGGQIAGDALAKLLNGKGKVVMLRYEAGSASTMAREKGFLEAIAKYPGIQVVSSNLEGGATADSAQKKSESLLSTYKTPTGLSIDGIYTPNESTTFGMLLVLQQDGYAGKVKFVGFDSSPKLLEGLNAGQIDGLVLQNPKLMGYLGVKTLVDSIRGKKIEKSIDTGAVLVTKANESDPKIAELLAPPKE